MRDQMKKAELLFVPPPGLLGHLKPTIEFANLLVNRDDRLSATILIMKPPFGNTKIIDTCIESLPSSPHIRFIHLPQQQLSSEHNSSFLYLYIENQKIYVKEAMARMLTQPARLAAVFVDMFCTTMIDLAYEFGVPSYVFFTSGAGFLGLMLHFQSLLDSHNQDFIASLENNSNTELVVPGFSKPVPARVLPPMALDTKFGLQQARRFRETKGIVVNTFAELEPYAVKSLANDSKSNAIPQVYPIGPLLNLEGQKFHKDRETIFKWLDNQPPSSVVFLCFGSMGCFNEDQVKEIACGVEKSGFRFVWSLRRPDAPTPPQKDMDHECMNLTGILPEGFLERTARRGMVMGWAPQVAILAHPSVGGFVSHCGWNSVLESAWQSVPMATWPIFGEQQLNGWEMVRELGLAVEITLEYMRDFSRSRVDVVRAEEIEGGIRKVMDMESSELLTKRMEKMKEKSREALRKDGSSYLSLDCLIKNVMDNWRGIVSQA